MGGGGLQSSSLPQSLASLASLERGACEERACGVMCGSGTTARAQAIRAGITCGRRRYVPASLADVGRTHDIVSRGRRVRGAVER